MIGKCKTIHFFEYDPVLAGGFIFLSDLILKAIEK